MRPHIFEGFFNVIKKLFSAIEPFFTFHIILLDVKPSLILLQHFFHAGGAVNVRNLLLFLGALAVLYFGLVMTGEVVPYFQFQYAMGFLGTKTDAVLQQPAFQWAFYIHISSSLVVIFAGLLQFIPIIWRKYKAVHRNTGKLYILFILILAAPSGAVLGWYANAGLPARVAFLMQSIVWWAVTAAAWGEIARQRLLPHVNMMIRSFAVTLAAMSLRTESYFMFYFLGTKPMETYITVSWLSWTGNLLLAETLIYLGLGRRMLALFNPSKQG